MSASVQVFILASCIVGLIGFAYSWFFLLRTSEDKSFSWRDWVSVGAVSLASLAVLLRIVLPGLMPPANWGTGAGVDAQIHVVQFWTKVSVRMYAAALLFRFGWPTAANPANCACMLRDGGVLDHEYCAIGLSS